MFDTFVSLAGAIQQSDGFDIMCRYWRIHATINHLGGELRFFWFDVVSHEVSVNNVVESVDCNFI